MTKSMGTMSYYLVLAFVAAQFIYAFRESNVGILIALKGGEFLKRIGVSPQITIVGVVLISALFDLLIASASAKWAGGRTPWATLSASILKEIARRGKRARFQNPATGNFLGVFVAGNATNDLNRPEGIAFGPDGNIYVASFRANAGDTDKVLEFNGTTGAYIDKIDLDQVGQPRAFAQAILFGPGGDLFVPITGNGPDTGAVRRYDVHNKTFTNFVADLYPPKPHTQFGTAFTGGRFTDRPSA